MVLVILLIYHEMLYNADYYHTMKVPNIFPSIIVQRSMYSSKVSYDHYLLDLSGGYINDSICDLNEYRNKTF